MNGEGTISYADGNSFTGTFVNGEPQQVDAPAVSASDALVASSVVTDKAPKVTPFNDQAQSPVPVVDPLRSTVPFPVRDGIVYDGKTMKPLTGEAGISFSDGRTYNGHFKKV